MSENLELEQEAVIEDSSNDSAFQEPVISNIRYSGETEFRNPESFSFVEDEPQVASEAPAQQAEAIATEEPKAEAQVETTPATPTASETKVEAIDPFEALGFTEAEQKEYMKKFAEAVKTGTVNEFLEVTSKNYDAMSDVDLLRISLQREHPNASERQIELLTQRKLQEYNITGEDEELDADGIELLKLTTDKVREALKQEQKAYVPPTYQPQSNPEQAQIEAQKNEFLQFVEKNPDLIEFERNKTISFGDFKAEIPQGFNPREQTINPNAFFAQFDSADGSLDMQKWMKTALFASNPDKYIQDAINYGKSLKEKENFDELRGNANKGNNSLPNNGGSEPVITNIRYTGGV